MSNQTANGLQNTYGKEGRHVHVPVDGGTHIYAWGLVSQLTATGMLVPTSTSGCGPAIGVSTHEVDNSDGSDGDVRCRVLTDQIFIFANGTSTDACSEATLFGTQVYSADDHTIYDNDASGTLKPAGLFAGMEPDGRVRVFVSALAAHPSITITALTDNSAGTANNTIQAMADPTDSPATADALRDDLVANLLPAIRNNFADLAAKVNELISATR